MTDTTFKLITKKITIEAYTEEREKKSIVPSIQFEYVLSQDNTPPFFEFSLTVGFWGKSWILAGYR
ncbi:hypothetical protein [Xanthovirga aplysinae]|uniref:hypothetical protein n=1 Tax=Xanthovirga aplysinae TaxID=2529853 RepID=UPI0012BBBC06|nr:hypothetical protein [Xanthovirga aplysinae]MTI29443.1 hypothetical protein [Xanthovirga aplysinae]